MKGRVTTRDEAFDDYIFCGADNGSAERTVLASLGGLRTDGRIGSTLWRSRSLPSPWRLGVARLSSLGDGWRERPQWHGVGIDSRAKVVGILTVAILAPAWRGSGGGFSPGNGSGTLGSDDGGEATVQTGSRSGTASEDASTTRAREIELIKQTDCVHSAPKGTRSIANLVWEAVQNHYVAP